MNRLEDIAGKLIEKTKESGNPLESSIPDLSAEAENLLDCENCEDKEDCELKMALRGEKGV